MIEPASKDIILTSYSVRIIQAFSKIGDNAPFPRGV
jgi:hypothetical protein